MRSDRAKRLVMKHFREGEISILVATEIAGLVRLHLKYYTLLMVCLV